MTGLLDVDDVRLSAATMAGFAARNALTPEAANRTMTSRLRAFT